MNKEGTVGNKNWPQVLLILPLILPTLSLYFHLAPSDSYDTHNYKQYRPIDRGYEDNFLLCDHSHITIIAGLIALAMFNTNPLVDRTSIATTVYAQSQAQSQQQQSQPPAEQQKPQPGTQYIFNNKSLPANAPENCASLASVVSGKGIPDYNLCDVVVYRQAPAITRNDGLVLNNFSGIGHYIEFMPAALNNTGAFQANTTTNQNVSAAFGEWALLDSEVVPVQNVMQKYNWTQTALHHHMLNESPKILFLHWSVTGNANDLINQAKEIIMQTSTYQSQQPRAPTSAGP